jgi:copper(I)-binding protein
MAIPVNIHENFYGDEAMRCLATLLIAIVMPIGAHAQLTVHEPWARATVSGQKATGVFMKLETASPVVLVGVRSPVAGVAELHEMKHEGDRMTMRPVSRLPLAAGQVTELKPGGYHIMLMDLKAPLAAGQRLPLVLVVENDKAKRQEYEVDAEVLPVNTTAFPRHDAPSHGKP